ncbi:glycosyltransferase [Azohydromonas lata]|uniref:glycosyltransferase n=1 Tax=Azohydromonas lata TaxID=45677 RepID=UPI0008360AC3|nr:glycosyltransferase [Azohydromonas lata]
MSPVEIAVVIPTCRRPDLLRRCLQALLRQRLDPARFEVLVVDDGRSDDTRAVVDELAACPPGLCLQAAGRRVASLAPAHVAEMLVTSFAIPYLAVYWRFVGAWRFRVLFI